MNRGRMRKMAQAVKDAVGAPLGVHKVRLVLEQMKNRTTARRLEGRILRKAR